MTTELRSRARIVVSLGRRLAPVPLAVGVSLAGTATSAEAHASDLPRTRGDQDEITFMNTSRPAAANEFAEGEAILANVESTADVEKALAAFDAAVSGAPEAALPLRRKCQALTALGRRDDAIQACERSLSMRTDAVGYRALVGALVSGERTPPSADVARALYLGRRAAELEPYEPWGFAATCDVASKLGNLPLLRSCVADLERVAPEHYETKRAAARAAALGPGRGLSLAWLSIASAALGTLVHAAYRRFRRPVRATARGVIAAALTALTLSSPALAGSMIPGKMSKTPIDADDPMKSVPSPAQRDKDPLEYGYFLMDLSGAAEDAAAKGDHAAAAKFYRAFVKAVPDAIVSYRKTCEQYEAANDLAHAKEFCAAGLTQSDVTLGDYSHYARVVFAGQGALDPKDVVNLDAIVAQLKKDEAARTVAWDIQCNLGVRLGDPKRLRECAPPWAAIAPREAKVVFFQWVLSMHEKNYAEAQELVALAREAKEDPARLREMEQATTAALPLWKRGFRDWRLGALVAAVVAGCLAVLVLKRPGEPART